MVKIKKNKSDVVAIILLLIWFIGNVIYFFIIPEEILNIGTVIETTLLFVFYFYCFWDTNKISLFVKVVSILRIYVNICNLINDIQRVFDSEYALSLSVIVVRIGTSIFCIILYLVVLLEAFKKNRKISAIALAGLILYMILCIVSHISTISTYVEHSFMENPYLDYSYSLNHTISILFDLIVIYAYYKFYSIRYLVKKEKEKLVSVEKRIALTEDTLESIKEKYDNGEITEEEFNQRKTEIIKAL